MKAVWALGSRSFRSSAQGELSSSSWFYNIKFTYVTVSVWQSVGQSLVAEHCYLYACYIGYAMIIKLTMEKRGFRQGVIRGGGIGKEEIGEEGCKGIDYGLSWPSPRETFRSQSHPQLHYLPL
jgi:hypothetical protein